MNDQSCSEQALDIFTPDGHLTLSGANRFFKGDLSEDEQAQVKAHLDQCPEGCKEATEDFRRGAYPKVTPLRILRPG